MIIDFIKYSSFAVDPRVPDRFLSGTLTGPARTCTVFLAANQFGVDLYPPFDMSVTWRGNCSFDVVVENEETLQYMWAQEMKSLTGLPTSFYCSKIPGVFQLDIGWIFRTECGVKLLLTGPVNRPHESIGVHMGLVDSDWFHIPFTINVQFLQQDKAVILKKERPVARLIPIAEYQKAKNCELHISAIHEENEILVPWRKYIEEVYGPIGAQDDCLIRKQRGVYQQWKAQHEGLT